MPRDFKMKIVEKIDRVEVKKGNEKVGENRIAVIQYNDYPCVLEKRNWYVDEDGNLKMGKAKGFNYKEFKILLDHKDRILKALKPKK